LFVSKGNEADSGGNASFSYFDYGDADDAEDYGDFEGDERGSD
jgi:hypothetical protein